MTKLSSTVIFPRIFDEQSQTEPLEILAASLIASRMLWAEEKEDRNRSLYMTLCLRKIHDLLLEADEDNAQTVFAHLVKTYFGGWPQYSQNLASAKFPTAGKGSLQERAWQGEITGLVFAYAYRNAVSLNDAAKAVSEDVFAVKHEDVMRGMLKPAPENIMRNYWPRFQTVAHFWAAMPYFVMPELEDSIIRLDRAAPHPDFLKLRPGWRGIMDLAHGFLKGSADVKRYKTHKPLLDSGNAFHITFA